MGAISHMQRIVYASLMITITHGTYTEEITTNTVESQSEAPHTNVNSSHKEAAQKLEAILQNCNLVMRNIRNTVIQVSMLLHKYGKNVNRQEDAIKEINNSMVQLEMFTKNQLDSILHYLQQDFNTIPDDGYQEIYTVFSRVLNKANQLLDALKKQIKNNFQKPLNVEFLTIKGTDLHTAATMDPDAIIKYCESILHNSSDLYMAGTTIGLTNYNKICRFFEKYFAMPFRRYHVGAILEVGTFATFSSLFLYWITNCDKYDSPKEIAEHLRNENINNQTSTTGIPTATMDAAAAKPARIESKTRLTEFVEWLCGKVPTTVDGRWCMPGATAAELTKWNRSMCLLYNLLPNHTNPIVSTICYGGGGYFLNKHGIPLLPHIKNAIANWWQRSLGGASAEMSPVGTWEYDPRITFDHVIGLDHIKSILANAIAYAENPDKYAQTANAIPTNYIFYGIRRTGKSFMAEAMAGEMKKRNPRMRVLKVPCDAFREMGVQQTIDFIRAHAPCIAFIDEADLGNFARSLDRRTTSELLKALGDGNISPDPSLPVFLIFATNKLEAIDTSLVSYGRFGTTVLFTNPTLIDRWQFIVAKLESIGLNPQDFDLDKLAEKTEGNSFEEIGHCITVAKEVAINTNTTISTELIMNTINETLHGIYPEFPRELHKEAIDVLSAHFAGKALITALTESNEVLDTVSICRRKLPLVEDTDAAWSGKPTRQPKYNYGIVLTRQQFTIENNAGPTIARSYYLRILAGVVAEDIILGKTTNQCHGEAWNSDSIIMAYNTALKECSDGGLYWYFDTQLGNAQKEEYFTKAKALIEAYKQEVRLLLEQHHEALNVIIRALKLYGTLDDRIVLSIIENPTEMCARIDAIEKEQEEYRQKMIAEYQAAAQKAQAA